MEDKKENEKRIVNFVYSDLEYNIVDTEQPDFILNRKGIDTKFGIEVTELYYDGSSARLKNIPNYISDIINNKYQHKDDKKNLEPVKVYINTGDKHNSKFEFFNESVIRNRNQLESFTFSKYKSLLIEIINKKNYKFEKYNKDLDFIDLHILDQESFFCNANKNVMKYFINDLEISNCVEQSNFRRICLFTRYMKKECMICFGDLSAEYKSAIYERIN